MDCKMPPGTECLCRMTFRRSLDADEETLFSVSPEGRIETEAGWNPDTLRAVADWLERQVS